MSRRRVVRRSEIEHAHGHSRSRSRSRSRERGDGYNSLASERGLSPRRHSDTKSTEPPQPTERAPRQITLRRDRPRPASPPPKKESPRLSPAAASPDIVDSAVNAFAPTESADSSHPAATERRKVTVVKKDPSQQQSAPVLSHPFYAPPIPDSVPPRYAYVWLVMRGNAYIPGVLVSAYSIRLTATPHELVCLVTEDVTHAARQLLRRLFDDVIVVPYMSARVRQLRSAKQQQLYESWQPVSFTKWNCLSLTQYTKVLFLDADVIAMASIDHLFQLHAPAGTFSSPRATPFLEDQTYSESKSAVNIETEIQTDGTTTTATTERKRRSGFFNPYNELKHGDLVPWTAIEQGIHANSFVAIGTTLLLHPNKLHYDALVNMLSVYAPLPPEYEAALLPMLSSADALQGFGFEGCNSMSDEQAITFFYHTLVRQQWTHIHQSYNFIPWHRAWLQADDLPYVFHFNTTPWTLKRHDWLDLEAWWQLVILLLKDGRYDANDRALMRTVFDESELSQPAQVGCCWCKYSRLDQWMTHSVFAYDGKLQCPQLRDRAGMSVHKADVTLRHHERNNVEVMPVLNESDDDENIDGKQQIVKDEDVMNNGNVNVIMSAHGP